MFQNIPSAFVAAVVAVVVTSGCMFLQMRVLVLLLVLAIVILVLAIPLWHWGLLGSMNGFDATPRVGIVKRFSDRNGWGVIACEDEDLLESSFGKETTKNLGSRTDVRFYREDRRAFGLKIGSTVSFNTVKDHDAPGWLRAVNIKVVTTNAATSVHALREGANTSSSSLNGVHKIASSSLASARSSWKPERKREPERFVIGSPTGTSTPNSVSYGKAGMISTPRLTLDLCWGQLQGLKLLVLEDQPPAGLLVVEGAEEEAQMLRKPTESPGVRPGDVIVQVGGACAAAQEMLRLVHQAADARGSVQVVVQPRPASFEAELDRTGPLWDKLGLSVAIDKKNPSFMVVRAIREEGLAADWNRSHSTLRICIGDRIDRVNECSGSAVGMNAEIQKSGQGSVLRLLISTPPNRQIRGAG